MPRSFEGDLHAAGLRFAVVASRFHDEIVAGLLDGALSCLDRHGAAADDVSVYRVPGAFEIPALTAALVAAREHDAVITLGCLIRGDTPHFEYISAQVTSALSGIAVAARFPVVFGVITCNTLQQAVDRSVPGRLNKGWEAALAAIEMANLWKSAVDRAQSARDES